MLLPNEIICQIAEYLNFVDFKSFAFVSKNFYGLSKYTTQYYKVEDNKLLYNVVMKSLHAFKTVYYSYGTRLEDTSFSYACRYNHIDIVTFLISKVDRTTLAREVNGENIYKNVELIKLFVAYGIDIPNLVIYVENFGISSCGEYIPVLVHACIDGSLEVVKYLVENKCDLVDINVAFKNGKDEIRSYLLEKGATVETPSENYVYLTVKSNELILMECYLQNGFVSNKNLCLELAYCCRNLRMAELLIKYGATARPGIYSGQTEAITNAIKYNYRDLIQILHNVYLLSEQLF